tara:strand:- start:239 stop:394 length:156 start_codon:yes stop_codon:yes gene_type:complete
MPGKTLYGNTDYGLRKDGSLGPIPKKPKEKPLTKIQWASKFKRNPSTEANV